MKTFDEKMKASEEMEETKEYHAFTEKFKPKKTTDDCYTPPKVYDAIALYVSERYGIDPERFVRPFYPGGSYEDDAYPEGAVVVDNPPFSIFRKILSFYQERNIPFFLFCDGRSAFGSVASVHGVTLIAPMRKSLITYENGAEVRTFFATNMEPKILVRTDERLGDLIEEAQKNEGKSNGKYIYPDELLSVKSILYFAAHSVPYEVERRETRKVANLDALRKMGKGVFGGGVLLSERAAAERAAAERIELSEREKEIVRSIGR